MFWLQNIYKLRTFKPKKLLRPEPESTSDYTSSLKIYQPQPKPERTQTGSEPNFHIIRMGLILINPKNRNPIG